MSGNSEKIYELMRLEYHRGSLYKVTALGEFRGDVYASNVMELVRIDKKVDIQFSLFAQLAVYVRNIGVGELAKEIQSNSEAVEVRYHLLDKERPTNLKLKGY